MIPGQKYRLLSLEKDVSLAECSLASSNICLKYGMNGELPTIVVELFLSSQSHFSMSPISIVSSSLPSWGLAITLSRICRLALIFSLLFGVVRTEHSALKICLVSASEQAFCSLAKANVTKSLRPWLSVCFDIACLTALKM